MYVYSVTKNVVRGYLLIILTLEITLFKLSICTEAFSQRENGTDEVITHTFNTKLAQYIVVINRLGSQSESEDYCNTEFGANLVMVTYNTTLSMLRVELNVLKNIGKLTDSPNEIWVGGKTDFKTSGKIDIGQASQLISDSGGLCVMLSDWSADPDLPTTFNLYTKACQTTESNFVCVIPNLPAAKFLYMETPGKCSLDEKLSEASIYINQTGCSLFAGQILNGPTVDGIVLCQFDLCGTNETEGLNGIVLSTPGHCPGTDVFSTLLYISDSMVCTKLQGQLQEFRGFGEAYASSYCVLDICQRTRKPNGQVYSFSNANLCDIQDRVGIGHFYTKSQGKCEEVKGKAFLTGDGSYRCELGMCRIGPADCKTSQTGKEYTGSLSLTISGKTCQRWDSNVPHNHGNTNPDWFPDGSLADAANYCRNPGDWMEGPFCHTTDPDVTWEICDIPFCSGSGPRAIDYQVGYKRYILVPGQHYDTTEFCQKAYGAGTAIIESESERTALQTWFARLQRNGDLKRTEIWVGGRAPPGTKEGQLITNYQSVNANGNNGHCLLLSNWNPDSKTYQGQTFKLYAEDCPAYYYRQFLCETDELRIDNYEVDGGVPQMGVHDMEACKLACTGNCRAAGYHKLEETCWHYFDSNDCRPGRSTWQFIYFQKAPCECHKYLILMDEGVKLSASSVAANQTTFHSVNRAKLDTVEEVVPGGMLAGAWVPDASDNTPWIQATFKSLRTIYGIVTLGMSGEQSMITSYQMKYSSSPTCTEWTMYGDNKVFAGNQATEEAVTVILEKAVVARCVMILPKTFNHYYALRFDVLGCIEQPNIALGKITFPGKGENNMDSWVAVDGFVHKTFSWKSCYLSTQKHEPWLAVYLVDRYNVKKIKIYTRKECCDGQIKGVTVGLYESWDIQTGHKNEEQNLCANIQTAVHPGEVVDVDCPPDSTGKYVVLQKHAANDRLAVCEVKVYGEKSLLQNVALQKPARQSSTFPGHEVLGRAINAVDGNTENVYNKKSCTHTKQQSFPWWVVDLEDEYTIHKVYIVGRADCCGPRVHDLSITVGGNPEEGAHMDLCALETKKFTNNEKRTIHCRTPQNGRYVKLSILGHSDYLTLCEVMVFGEPVKESTYSGNAGGPGVFCYFPFVYNGTSYNKCINKDEKNRFWCSTTPDYDKDQQWGYCMDVKLSGGRVMSEGLVTVRAGSNFTWGTVCDDDWDDVDAKVVCKQLGYLDGKAVFPPYFEEGSGDIAIGNAKCEGNEDSLLSCEHTKKPQQCVHHEDAAVRCSNPDQARQYGYPSFNRVQTDSLKQGTIILPENQAIATPGKVTLWNFYSVKNSTELILQIWRRVYDLEGQRYMLIGGLPIEEYFRYGGQVLINDPNSIRVQAEDLLGFTFSGGNPIPYDYSFHCQKHGKIKFSPKKHTNVGNVYTFPTKDDPTLSCRLYSLYVTVEVESVVPLNTFLYDGGFYKIYVARHTKISADTLCKAHNGPKSHILKVDSKSEYHYVKQYLLHTKINGSFWLDNSIIDETLHSDWAPCQPEKGKDCVVISNNNGQGQFFWYTKSCIDSYYFICENPVKGLANFTLPTGYSNIVFTPTIQPTPKQEYTKSKDYKTKHIATIVLSIIIPAAILLAIVLLLIYLRKRRRSTGTFALPANSLYATESTCPLTPDIDDNMSVVSEPSKGCVKLHKNDNNETNDNEIQYIDGIENPIYGKIINDNN